MLKKEMNTESPVNISEKFTIEYLNTLYHDQGRYGQAS